MNIGQRIKSKREFLNISQTDLAKKVGISKQTLYKYEKGIVTHIPPNIIESLAYNLNCSPVYLMGWADNTDFAQVFLGKIKKLDQNDLNSLMDYADFLIQKSDNKLLKKKRKDECE